MTTSTGDKKVCDQIVERLVEVRESILLTSQEKRLWSFTLNTLAIVFAPRDGVEQALQAQKAWEETPDGLAHALATAVVEHFDIVDKAIKGSNEEGVWERAKAQRAKVVALVAKYREVVQQ